MITLKKNGHTFEYMTASGALAYDGRGWWWERPLVWMNLIDTNLFTHVTKTLTYERRKGNLRMYAPWHCIRLIPNGTLNAVGLTNPGFRWWMNNIGPRIRQQDIKLIVSINQEDNAEQTKWMAKILDAFDIVGIELNTRCPNVAHAGDEQTQFERTREICQYIRDECRHPLIVKLTSGQNISNAMRLSFYADAFSINSVPWRKAFPHHDSPLEKLGGGGVSGQAAQPVNWAYCRQLTSAGLNVIGPSVWEFEDIARLRSFGVKAVSFGAIHIPHPTWPTKFVLHDREMIRSGAYNRHFVPASVGIGIK